MYFDVVLNALPEAALRHLEALMARIVDCRDLAPLDAWLRRAATARSVDDLFG